MTARKIEGTIVCHRRDEYGEIIVADEGAKRSLYFGEGILQSSIRLDQPGRLIGDYSQAMICGLIFKHDPRSVLLVGLGGCSLVHFLLRAFPDCAVDVVEIRQQVIELAYDFFLLPKKNANLRIFHAAGQDFIMQQEEGCRNYDLIIVDAFDNDGPAADLSEKPFLAACRQRLKEDGICSFNLWSRPKDNFPALYTAIEETFEGSTLKLLPDETCWNAIVFGFIRPLLSQDMAGYRQMARTLQQAYDINFTRYLSYLCWQNFS
jgi:spermidine synthase